MGNGPVGQVALVFTEVENSAELWRSHESDMCQGLHTHNALIRILMGRYNGYEVRFWAHGQCRSCLWRLLPEAVSGHVACPPRGPACTQPQIRALYQYNTGVAMGSTIQWSGVDFIFGTIEPMTQRLWRCPEVRIF